MCIYLHIPKRIERLAQTFIICFNSNAEFPLTVAIIIQIFVFPENFHCLHFSSFFAVDYIGR